MKADDVVKDVLADGYTGKIFAKKSAAQNRIMVGIPMTGLLRSEWVLARYGQVIPCNWSQVDCLSWIDQYSPLNFSVADARNIIATSAVEEGFEWLFFIDHDTILPPMALLKINEYMLKADTPVVSGLYFTKSVPSEPLIYRGRGNSYFADWHLGEKVWVDGIPMGCTLIHSSILKALYEESEAYQVVAGKTVRRIFETPSRTWFDPETRSWFNSCGTEDLEWCTRVMTNKIFEKAGWKDFEGKEYPFLMDTSIFCRHIDWDGTQYPAHREEAEFLPEEFKQAG
jgi:hypothetical protein